MESLTINHSVNVLADYSLHLKRELKFAITTSLLTQIAETITALFFCASVVIWLFI